MSKRRWAVIALVLAVGCSSGGDPDDDAQRDETQDDRGVVELASRVVGPGGIVGALQDERNASMQSAVGLRGIVDAPGLEEMRAATDEQLDAVARADGGDAYPQSEEIASVLETLRQEVDALAGPGAGLGQFDRARQVHERYREVVDQYQAAGRESVAESVADPAVREGLDLQLLVSDVIEREQGIIFWFFGDALAGVPAGSEEIAELSRLATEQRADVEALQATEREPYRSVIESSFPEEHYESMQGFVDKALDGEPISPAGMLGAYSVDDPSYWALMRALDEAVVAETG